MNTNLSYNALEEKLQYIKCSLNNLCNILDQYKDVPSQKEIDTISIVSSLLSYHTALDSLSLSSSDTYFSAVDQIGGEELSIPSTGDQCLEELKSTLLKKTVSFSNSVTILEVHYLKNKKRLFKKDQLVNIKGKFLDYIYREKFYIKYKWQKLKHTLFKSHKNDSFTYQNHQQMSQESFRKFSSIDYSSDVKTIDIKLFFQEMYKNSVIETDLDENSVTVIRENYTVPLTDLTTTVTCDKSNTCQSKVEYKKETTSKSQADQSRREMTKVQPKLYTQCESIQKANLIENNLLLKYLISKAQYPIQLKIATSIVKLNLPHWYQSSLISC